MTKFRLLIFTFISILITTLSFQSAELYANDLNATKNNIALLKKRDKFANFDLDREITIYGNFKNRGTIALCNSIADLLKESGTNDVKVSRNRGEFNINVEKVDLITGVESEITDAYCIKVYKNSVDIQYMTTKSMAWAYQALQKIVVENKNFIQKMFGLKSLYIQASSLCETTGHKGGFEIVDITANRLNVESLKTYINTAALNNKFVVYLKLVSTSGVGVKSELMNSVNPFIELTNGGLSYGELREIGDYASKNGIDLIPLLDLVSDNNSYFEKYTGHNIHSTEGLRFSLALINEFATKTGYEVICLGGEPSSDVVKKKYVDPIVELLNTYEKSVIIHTDSSANLD